jgi:uracil-DNA glycosylase
MKKVKIHFLGLLCENFTNFAVKYFMQPKLHPSWQTILSEEIQKPYFQDLVKAVDEEYKNHIFFPAKELLFAAFDHCSFDD